MKLRDKLPGNGRSQFPPQAYEAFEPVTNAQIAEWQSQVVKEHSLDEGEWELIDGAEAN